MEFDIEEIKKTAKEELRQELFKKSVEEKKIELTTKKKFFLLRIPWMQIPDLVYGIILSLVLGYLTGSFITWDYGWLSYFSEFSIPERIFVSLGSLVFLTFFTFIFTNVIDDIKNVIDDIKREIIRRERGW